LLNKCDDVGDGVAIVVRAWRGLSVTDKGLLCLKQVVSARGTCLLSTSWCPLAGNCSRLWV